jgi:hypothetical protein
MAIDREDQAIERWPIEGRIRPEGEEKRLVEHDPGKEALKALCKIMYRLCAFDE